MQETGSEETGPETVVLLSQSGQVVVKQYHERETPAFTESQDYYNFCYNSQICFLTNACIHFYILCANNHLSLRDK